MPALGLGLILALLAQGVLLAQASPVSPTLSVGVLLEARALDIDLSQVDVMASSEGLEESVPAKSHDGVMVHFELSADRSWSITCRDETYWCPSLSIARPSGESASTRRRLPVARRVNLRAGLEVSRGELPIKVKLQGWETTSPTSSTSPTAELLELELELVVEDGRIDLELPDIPLDLRVAAAGFAPLYTWGLKPSALPKTVDGTRALGRWTMRPGSSLCGFVTDGVTGNPVEGAEIQVRPPPHRPGTPNQTARRMRRMTWEAESNERGFFQVVGLPAGVYRIEVTPVSNRRLPRIMTNVELADQSETCIESLEMQPAIPFQILLDSPSDVGEESPWKIRLNPISADGHVVPRDPQGPNHEGIVHFQVAPGDYRLVVFSQDPRMRALSQQITVQTEQTLSIQLDILPVEGRVFLGETPLVAEIDLNVDDGGFVRLESDGEGRFRGWTRRPEDSLVVQVKAVHPEFSRYVVLEEIDIEAGVLRLELEFPDRRITGTVQDEAGRPVRSARVTARPESSRLAVSTRSGVDGRFELVGLEDAPQVLHASAREIGDSDSVRVEPGSEGVSPDISLVLRRGRTLEGRVLTDLGEPVAAGRVNIITIGGLSNSVHDTTNISGVFEVKVPETATRAIVQVYSSRINWSACLLLPAEGQPMEVRLPSTFGGSVYIPQDDSMGPLAQRVLLNTDGGFFTLSGLINYGNSRSADRGHLVSSIAPGAYAFFISHESISDFSERVCDRVLPVEGWRPLAEGQELRFNVNR